jgi:ribose-phosphate pyrophosphokinase
MLTDYFRQKNLEDLVIVSPDHGSVKRARNMAKPLNVPIAIIDKRRPEANKSEIMNVIGDVKGKTCILFDDMVDTAGSLCNAANALVEVGGAKEVYACATHGVLSGPAFDRIESSAIKELVVHNTIPLAENCPCKKIKQLDVAPIFARAIAHVHGGTSIADLF